MNLGALRERVRTRVGVATGDRFIDTATLTMAVNDAMRLLDAEHDWPWLEARTLLDVDYGVSEVSLPLDCRDVRSVLAERTNSSPPSWEELTEVAPVDAIQSWAQPGRVDTYGLFANKLLLFPPPSQPVRLTLLYYRLSPNLAVDDDVPLVPEQYQDAVVCAAAAQMASREDDRSSQAAHLADYQAWVNRMRAKVSRRTKPVTPRIRPGGWAV